MSHTTRIPSVKVTNIAALERAVAHLNQVRKTNMTVTRNSPCRLWSTRPTCDVVVNVPGSRFDVGFTGDEVNGYAPVFDAHGGILYPFVGGGREIAKTVEEHTLSMIGGLMQAYAVEAVSEVAGNNNAMVESHTNDETGEVVLLVA